MKVMKIEVLVIDFDGLGEAEVKSVIENARYPNHCVYPEVKSIEAVDVEWSDDHPLNKRSQSSQAYQQLFSDPEYNLSKEEMSKKFKDLKDEINKHSDKQ